MLCFASLPCPLGSIALQVAFAALVAGYGAGLGLVAANRYLEFSDEPLAFAAIGFTGFFYGVFSAHIYREFRWVWFFSKRDTNNLFSTTLCW